MEGRQSCTQTSGNKCNCVYLQCATLLEGLINSPFSIVINLSSFSVSFSFLYVNFVILLLSLLHVSQSPSSLFLSLLHPLFHPHPSHSFSYLLVCLLTISLCFSPFTYLTRSLFLSLYLLYSFFLSFSHFYQYTLYFFLSLSLLLMFSHSQLVRYLQMCLNPI